MGVHCSGGTRYGDPGGPGVRLESQKVPFDLEPPGTTEIRPKGLMRLESETPPGPKTWPLSALAILHGNNVRWSLKN